jgi:hypothetical protein
MTCHDHSWESSLPPQPSTLLTFLARNALDLGRFGARPRMRACIRRMASA